MIEFILNNKWIIIFYSLVFLLVFVFRKKLEVHFGVFALYKTRLGIGLMDALGKRFAKPIRLLGYAGIIVGFVAMLVVVGFLFFGLYQLLFVPDAPATISPVLPGVRVPGTTFFIPFWYGIIAIFVVAVVHEFFHGVVARAHKVEIKSTGPFVLGPFFGAFVEPDEADLKRRKDIVQYSIFAAGPFANFLLAGLVLLVMSFVLVPAVPVLFQPVGVSFSGFSNVSPAADAGFQKEMVYNSFNGKKITNSDELLEFVGKLKPGDTLTVADEKGIDHKVSVGSNPSNSSLPYLGVVGISNRYQNEGSLFFAIFGFVYWLFYFVFILSIGVGTANLLPIGPIDGGRMVLLLFKRFFGEEKGNMIWAKVSLIFLFFIILLMTPIFRATFHAISGTSG